MNRANRLLIVGIIVTLVGGGLVGLVLLVERPPVRAETQTEVPPPVVEADVAADEQDEFDPRIAVLEHLDDVDDVEVVALTVDFESSVAGLPQVGDRVNVYGVPEPDDAADADATEHAEEGTAGDVPIDDEEGNLLAGSMERLLTDVVVLGITGAVHEGNGGTPTLVIAVPSAQMPGALSAHRYESVHFTLVAGPDHDADEEDSEAGSDPVDPTPDET